MAAFTDKGKFLLAARRYKNGARTEYIISLDPEDLSQGSKAYVGKLRLEFPSWSFWASVHILTSCKSCVILAVLQSASLVM